MSADFSNNPENAREARITALLLGELSEAEAAALREEIARDAELSKLYERLSRAIGLVKEAATSADEAAMPQPEQLKLSEEKREKLLASFKVIHTPQLAPWYRRIRVSRELTTLAAMILVLAVLSAFVLRKQFTGPQSLFAVASNESTSDSDMTPHTAVLSAGEEAQQTLTVTVDSRGEVQPRNSSGAWSTAYDDSDFVRAKENTTDLSKEKLLDISLSRDKQPSSGWSEARTEAPEKPARGAVIMDFSAGNAGEGNTPALNPPGSAPAPRRSLALKPDGRMQGGTAPSEAKSAAPAPSTPLPLIVNGIRPQSSISSTLDGAQRKAATRPLAADTPAGAVDREWNAPNVNSPTDIAALEAVRRDRALPEEAEVRLQRESTSAMPAEPKSPPAAAAPLPGQPGTYVAGTILNSRVSGAVSGNDGDQDKVKAIDQLAQRNLGRGFGGIGGAGGGGAAGPVAGQENRFDAGYVVDTGVDPAITAGGSTVFFRHGGLAGSQSQQDGAALGFAVKDKDENGGARALSTFGSTLAGVENGAAQNQRFYKAKEVEELAKAPAPLTINGIRQTTAGDKVGGIVLPQLMAEIQEQPGEKAAPDRAGKPVAPTTLAIAIRPTIVKPTTGLPILAATETEDLSAEAPTLGRELLKKNVRDVNLGDALELYQSLSGRTVLRPNSLPEAKVRLPEDAALSRKDWLGTLEGVLSQNQVTMVPQGEKYVKAVPQAQAMQEAAEFNDLPADAFGNTSRYVTEVVQLKNQSAEDVAAALKPLAKMQESVMAIDGSRVLVLRDYEENVKRMRELVEKTDVPAAQPAQQDPATGLPLTNAVTNTVKGEPKTVGAVEDLIVPKQSAAAPTPQPEIYTAENPFSTFSLNVSDVSYKLAEASLQKGALPDAASIRSEEFINAFDYRDPEAAPGKPVAFAWERARYPFAHNRDLLRFSIKTAATGRQAGRPANLVLLLDNSGSMERADRVRIIKECLRGLATQLNPQDRVSVVSFARTPRLWVDGLAGTQAGELPERVGSLTPEGGTNLEEGMNLAYETARRHFVAHGMNRVVVLTDGAANLGDIEPGSLKAKVETHRKQGIALDCFGIGWEGYNDDLLEQLSRNGDGRYGFVNTPEAAATEFANQLVGALQVAASDVKVQVEFNPHRVTSYRQIGYAKHQLQKEQFRDNTVDAAEIAAAEAGNALYVVQVNPRGEGPLGVVRVRYKTPGTTEYYEHEWSVPFSGSVPSMEEAAPTLRLAGVASAFSEWLAASPYAAEVRPEQLLRYMSGVPDAFGGDPRPRQLESMIRQSIALAGSR